MKMNLMLGRQVERIGLEMNGTGSGECPVVGLGIGGAATTVVSK
jgi:hypothetical protein